MGPLGHFAVGLAAKPAAPKAPLWVLLAASETLDILCFPFLAAGIEKASTTTSNFTQGVKIITPGSMPWSHGLFMSLVWSIAAAAISALIFKDRRTSIVIGLVVFSHWILDLIVHLPDLPLLFNGLPFVGLGLWGSGPGLILSIVLEIGLFIGGLAIYNSSRKRSTLLVKEN